MMHEIYPHRWPMATGLLWNAVERCGGLKLDCNHMVLCGRKLAFDRLVAPTLDGFLEQHGRGTIRGKTTLSCLMPGCQTRGMHIDTGAAPYDDGACQKRYHIPLKTNPQALFNIDGTHYRMPEGSIYLINPLVPHAIMNGGDRPRVHLFFNALEESCDGIDASR